MGAEKKPATKESKPVSREGDKENRNNRFDGKRVLDARNPQDGPRESREERNNRRNKPETEGGAPRFQDKAPRGGRGGMRGEGRGGRGGRGEGRGGRGGGDRGGRMKRDFDRKSGDDRTGVKGVEKKEAGGSHNWGTFEDEMKAEEDKANTSDGMNDSAVEADPKEATEAPAPAAPAGPTAEDEEALARKAAEEEEAKMMTLDQWKAQQAKKEGPTFNLRKA